MMTKLIYIFVLMSVNLVYGGTTSVGNLDEGGKYFELNGCTTITNVTGNLDGYSVRPEMSREERIIFCDDNRYEASDMLGVLEQIAAKAFANDCFATQIDKENKTVEFKYLPGDKVVTHQSSSVDTYTLEGHNPVVRERGNLRVRHLCILDRAATEWPYSELLK